MVRQQVSCISVVKILKSQGIHCNAFGGFIFFPRFPMYNDETAAHASGAPAFSEGTTYAST